MTMTCRSARRLAIACGVAAALSAGSAAAQQSLTVTAFGGTTQDAQRKIYFEPFAKETGVTIREDSWTANLAPIEAMVQAKKVTWDVINMSPFLIDKACSSGLIEKLDLKLLPSADKYLPDSLHECGVKAALAAQIIAFNADKFPKDKQPSKLEHFWDVQAYPGKRGLRGRPNQTLEFALVSDGVAPDQIYKELGTEAGLQRAFKKLDSIKKNLHWWDSFAEPPQLLVAGEVTMSFGSDGRFSFAVKEGKPLKMIWEGAGESGNFWSIVKGSPNKDLAMKYVVFTQRHDIQVRQPEILGYAAPLKSVVAATPPEISKTLITDPGNRVRVWFEDAVFWTDHLDEYTKRFKKWQAE